MTALLVRSNYISFYFDCNYNHYFILSVDSAEELQSAGQELIHSIFGDDSDTEPETLSLRESATLNAQIAIPYNFQILTAKTSKENGTILQQEVILRLHDNYKRAKEDFQLTIETILRYLEYNMSFKTFFIFCESAPYTFYDELLKKDNSVKTLKKSQS